MKIYVLFLVIFVVLNNLENVFLFSDDGFTFTNKIRFPYGPIQGPFMGFFVALSMPVMVPNISMFFSYNMEANYNLPANISELTYPPLLSRHFSRKSFYEMLEFKMKSHGYPGKHCLLRTICEAALNSFEHTGILGDILHIILMPSTSKKEDTLKEYVEAEKHGKQMNECSKYNKKCSVSILEFFSIIDKFLHNKLTK